MRPPCTGKCKNYKPKRNARSSAYELGLVWCKICKTYLEKSILLKARCPCCTNRVRFSPKNKNRKKIVMEMKQRG